MLAKLKINVAEWLSEVRMTPGELADELGLPRGQISRMVVGEEEPDRVTTWALMGLREHRLREPVFRVTELPKVDLPKNALAAEFSGDKWASLTARLALPIIVETANTNKGLQLTYGQLHDFVVKRGGKEVGTFTKYAKPLGKIADAMNRLLLPPLTSIIVNAKTGLPSSGIDVFIKDYLRLDPVERDAFDKDAKFREAKVKQCWDDVYAYEKWTEVMMILGITGQPEYDR